MTAQEVASKFMAEVAVTWDSKEPYEATATHGLSDEDYDIILSWMDEDDDVSMSLVERLISQACSAHIS